MKLGPVRILIINQEGEEISRQIYDLSKSKGTAHWQKLWRWALHQGYSLQVTSIKESQEDAKPSTRRPERQFPHLDQLASLLTEPYRR